MENSNSNVHKGLSISDKAQKGIIIFFVSMIVLTFLSHVADSMTVPKVKVANIKKSSLTFEIKGSGNIVNDNNKYINVIENVKVSKINVKVGDEVKAGEVLFQYDMDSLKELYDEVNIQLQKSKINVNKATLDKSKQKQEIEKYDEQINNLRSIEDLKICQNKVEKAKDEYEKAYEKAKEKAAKQASDDVKEKQDLYDKAQKNYYDIKFENKEEIFKAESSTEEAEENLSTIKKAYKKSKDDEEKEEVYTKTDVNNVQNKVDRAKEELKNIKKRCNYNLEYAENEVEKAEIELENAGEEPFDYESELSPAVDKIDSANKNLFEAIRKSEDANTLLERKTRQNDIEQNNVDIQNEIDSLEIDSMNLDVVNIQKKVNELNEIIKNEGQVISNIDGIVNCIEIIEGKKTSTDEIVSISLDKCSVNGSISEEEAKKVSIGDKIYVSVDENKEPVEAIIEHVGISNENSMVEVDVSMPEGNYIIRKCVNFVIKKNSPKYDKCISIEALRSDDQGKYVLVTSEKDTTLGRQVVARKVRVNVIDNNYLEVAIKGDIDHESKIIVSSNRNIEENDRVRVEEDE